MSLNLTVGSTTIPLDNLADLESDLSTDLNLGTQFAAQLAQPISKLPDSLKTVSIQYTSGNQSWKLGDFGFTLSGGVSGKITVITSGALLSYCDGFATQVEIGLNTTTNANTTKSIPVPAGAAYVCIELDFQIQGGISASYTQGIYGVYESVNSNDSFTFAFYKRCQPSDLLKDALSAAFSDFVLPLHEKTLNNLKLGDYLHYNFNGTLQVGLGASIGFDKVYYAGQYKADIPGTAGAVAISASAKAEVQAGAKLACNFDYAGTFEALIWKDAATVGHLHLYRSDKQDVSLGVNLGVTLTSDPTASANVVNSQLESLFKQALGPLGSTFDSTVWPKVSSEITNYVNDANSKVAGWMKPLQQGQGTLDFAIDQTQQKFLLMDYTFDLTAPAFVSAWDAALNGKFLDAWETPNGGVSLGVGSGLEHFYDRKTSVTLNLFGKLNAAWTSEIISNSSLVYAGNGVFHLIADVGRRSIYQINNSKREVDIYFALEADLTTGTFKGSVDLHVVLTATNNQNFGGYISLIVGLMTSGPDGITLAKAVTTMTSQKNATESLHIILPPTAYARLKSSTIISKPPYDQSQDQYNFAIFANSCWNLKLGSPADFTTSAAHLPSLTYAVWSGWNIATNDQLPIPPNAVPNRRETGSWSNGVTYLSDLAEDSGISYDSIAYTLQAASDFMNLCDDLSNLGQLAAVSNLDNWDNLVGELKSIIQNDVSQDFVAPTTYAITRLCGGGPPTLVKGPASGMKDENSILVTLTYS